MEAKVSINYLPNEILEKIFGYLSMRDLFSCTLVKRTWNGQASPCLRRGSILNSRWETPDVYTILKGLGSRADGLQHYLASTKHLRLDFTTPRQPELPKNPFSIMKVLQFERRSTSTRLPSNAKRDRLCNTLTLCADIQKDPDVPHFIYSTSMAVGVLLKHGLHDRLRCITFEEMVLDDNFGELLIRACPNLVSIDFAPNRRTNFLSSDASRLHFLQCMPKLTHICLSGWAQIIETSAETVRHVLQRENLVYLEIAILSEVVPQVQTLFDRVESGDQVILQNLVVLDVFLEDLESVDFSRILNCCSERLRHVRLKTTSELDGDHLKGIFRALSRFRQIRTLVITADIIDRLDVADLVGWLQPLRLLEELEFRHFNGIRDLDEDEAGVELRTREAFEGTPGCSSANFDFVGQDARDLAMALPRIQKLRFDYISNFSVANLLEFNQDRCPNLESFLIFAFLDLAELRVHSSLGASVVKLPALKHLCVFLVGHNVFAGARSDTRTGRLEWRDDWRWPTRDFTGPHDWARTVTPLIRRHMPSLEGVHIRINGDGIRVSIGPMFLERMEHAHRVLLNRLGQQHWWDHDWVRGGMVPILRRSDRDPAVNLLYGVQDFIAFEQLQCAYQLGSFCYDTKLDMKPMRHQKNACRYVWRRERQHFYETLGYGPFDVQDAPDRWGIL